MKMMALVRTLIERVSRWVLRNKRPITSVNAVVSHYAVNVQALMQHLPDLIGSLQYPSVAEWETRLNLPNMPQDLARVLARLEFAVPLIDLIEIAEVGKVPLEMVARNYYRLESVLQLDWLRDAITSLPRDNRWQSLARSALRDDLYRMQHSLTGLALAAAGEDPMFAEKWLEKRARDVEVCHQMFAELQAFETLDLAMLSAGMRELSNHLLSS